MGCSPGPHTDPAAARRRNDRVQRGEFDDVVEDLAATITYEGGPHAADAAGSFRRMAKRAGPAVFLRQNTSLLARPDRRADLTRIICPTLLAWGQKDRFAAVEHGREMGARTPGARLVVLELRQPYVKRPDTRALVTDTLVESWTSNANTGGVDRIPQRDIGDCRPPQP